MPQHPHEMPGALLGPSPVRTLSTPCSAQLLLWPLGGASEQQWELMQPPPAGWVGHWSLRPPLWPLLWVGAAPCPCL